MDDFLSLMFKPFLACLILTGVHAYLGVHIVQRGVIFVDLALAQVAALGATVGFLWGWELHSAQSYLCSLVATLIGAVCFAWSRRQKGDIPQEATIGIVYAVSAAAAIIILSRAPHGGDELKSLFVGHLLFINWWEIFKIGILYAIGGLVLWRFHPRFMEVSLGYNNNLSSIRWWDLVFYSIFGLVVTSSTEIAGVLLVFSFLVVPPACATLFTSNFKSKIFIGWIIGFFVSCIGICLSYIGDIPTGATVVVVFGLTFLLLSLLKR